MEELTKILAAIAVLIVVLGAITCAGNTITEPAWNGGYCVEDGTRYELRAATRYTKIYVCPKCGYEVWRY